MTDSKPDACQTRCVHQDAVDRAAGASLPDEEVRALADLFKILGDPTRVRILRALARTELCVCDLSSVLGMSASAVSHQLRVLRSAKLVRFRREGKIVHYTLDDEHVAALVSVGLDHVRND